MDKSLLTGLLIGAAVAAGAGAVAGLKLMHRGPEYAEVLKVSPLTRTERTPRQECHQEQVRRPAPVRDEHQLVGTLAGALIGGVIGHQIGGGSGRDLATVAGAAGGGYAGNRIQKNLQDRNTVTTAEEKCDTVYDSSEKIVGYRVRYRLDGKEATVQMDHDPGPRIPLRDGRLELSAAAPAGRG
jgi:uncharacterized protein YcfJ